MAKAAIIDIGTNTFHLLIVEFSKTDYSIVHREKSPVKLGKGGMLQNNIAPDAQSRALTALQQFAKTCRKHHLNTDSIHAFATSAVRSATNGKDFVEKVKVDTTIHVEVIDGDREAELIYKGIQSLVDLSDNNTLMMDIGGGSTEFIIGNKDKSWWSKSFDLGVARMKETLPSSDPMTQKEHDQIKQELNQDLRPLWLAVAKWKPISVVGSSGTFESLLKMLWNDAGKEPDLAYPNIFGTDEFYAIHKKLIASTFKERLSTPGLAPMRAEYIVYGSILIDTVLDHLHCNQITYSDHALKEGFLAELTQID